MSLSRLRLLFAAELERRRLLRGGALLLGVAMTGELPGCGSSSGPSTAGSGSTTGSPSTAAGSPTSGTSGLASASGTGGSSSAASGGTTGASGTSSAPASTSGSATASSSGGGSTTAGCPGSCVQDANTFVVAASQIPVGGGVIFTDSRYTDTRCVGSGHPTDAFVVLQPTAGNFVALTASCTHQCCRVGVQASRSLLVCPCHGSEFDYSGAVVRGPATVPLAQLSSCFDGCNVFVQLA